VSALADIITQAATRHGVDPSALARVAQLESSMDPRAQNPNSSAGGLFQFIDRTARQYGLQDRNDPVQASDAAARLMSDNQRFLTSRLGRPPTPAELYLAHQQGAGGAAALLSNPNAPASQVVGPDAVRLNGGHDGMTAGEFAGLWLRRAEGGPRPPSQRGAGTPARRQAPAGGQNAGLAALLAEPDTMVIPAEAPARQAQATPGQRQAGARPNLVHRTPAPLPAQALITPDMMLMPEAPMPTFAGLFETPEAAPEFFQAPAPPAPTPARRPRGRG
jgi:hypothetical protein